MAKHKPLVTILHNAGNCHLVLPVEIETGNGHKLRFEENGDVRLTNGETTIELKADGTIVLDGKVTLSKDEVQL